MEVHCTCDCVSLEDSPAITIMTKDELGDVSVGGQCSEMGHGGGINRYRKPQRQRKMLL